MTRPSSTTPFRHPHPSTLSFHSPPTGLAGITLLWERKSRCASSRQALPGLGKSFAGSVGCPRVKGCEKEERVGGSPVKQTLDQMSSTPHWSTVENVSAKSDCDGLLPCVVGGRSGSLVKKVRRSFKPSPQIRQCEASKFHPRRNVRKIPRGWYLDV